MRKLVLFILSVFLLSGTVYYFVPEKSLSKDADITKLVVHKSERKMLAYAGDKLLKTYTISLGHNPVGPKQYEGDNRTPEGDYFIDGKNANSVCHKNLGISYPNETDAALAKKLGKSAGGEIKIHGLKNGQGFIGKFHRLKDWTNGCIGVTDAEIEELYDHVKVGTPISIQP